MINRPGTARAGAERFHADGTAAVSQQRLLVLLYERLTRDLADADDAMAAQDRNRSHLALVHGQEILAELDRALDHDAWEGAEQLSSLYRYLIGRLVEANIGQDRVALAECTRLVAPLAEAWTQAWAQVSSAPAPAPAPPGPAAPAGATTGVDAPLFERVPLDVRG